MKLLSVVFAIVLTSYIQATAQWERINDWGGPAADGCFSFVIDGNGYVGGGLGSSHFWRLDPANDTWSRKADIGGGPRAWAFSFVIDGKGYAGGGDPTGEFNVLKDFWQYDPASDSWSQMADFGGGGRDGMISFSLNGKGFAGAGFNGQYILSDFWKYDPDSDSWSQIGNYPGGAVIFPTVFIIDNVAYVGLGAGSSEYSSFYKFDGNSWVRISDFPGGARQAAIAFSIDGKGYVGGGMSGYQQTYTDFYEYDPETDTWTKVDDMNFPNGNTAWSTAFAIGSEAYAGTGADLPSLSMTKAFHKYDFDKTAEPKLAVSPGSIDFGSVMIGEIADDIFIIRNSGDAALEITGIQIESEHDEIFSLDIISFPMVIEAGETFKFDVHFAPAEEIEYSGDILINSNDKNSPHSIFLDGTGYAAQPELNLSVQALDFGQVDLNNENSLSFDIENTGNADLEISMMEIKDDPENVFHIESDPGTFTLAPGEKNNLTINFTPSEEKNYSASLSIQSNAGDEPYELPLSGEGMMISSVDDNSGGQDNFRIKLTPNPAWNQARVEIEYEGFSTLSTAVEIYDMQGNKVIDAGHKQIISGNNIIDLNLNNLTAGKYIVILKNSLGTFHLQMVIIN